MDKSAYSFPFLILVAGLTLTSAQNFEFESEKLGRLRGTISSTFGLTPYYQFQGIPYGDVLTNGRFLPSKLKTGKLVPDGSTFDARYPGTPCVQFTANSRQKRVDYGSLARFIANSGGINGNGSALTNSNARGAAGAEECLFINVFTRAIPTSKTPRSVPVVVFIHGGAFSAGSSDFYEGHRLLEEDVVLVTFNYRLGVLGFFSLDTNEAPGNAGMYDMLTALTWIQENIKDFGGDPSRVTITGQSAGSASVIHLMASPIVTSAPTPLFHKVIAFSGTGGNEWATVSPERATAASLKIAELVGCYVPNGSPPDTVLITSCMSALPDLDLLLNKSDAYEIEERRNGRLGFDHSSPSIQVKSQTPFPKFLVKNPLETFAAGEQLQVPLIMGTTRHDGSYPLGVLYNNYLVPNSYENDPIFLRENLLPEILKIFGVGDESNAVYDAIGKTYLEDTRHSGVFSAMMPGLIDLHSVFFFKADTYKTLQLHSQTVKNSFWYSFDYRGGKSLFNMLFAFNPPPVYGGISHGDDLIYLFGIPFYHNLNPDEMAVSDQLVKYIGNFAYTGNPTPDPESKELVPWPSYDAADKKFLSLSLKSEILSDFTNGWESVANELIPQPTPTTSTSGSTSTTTDGFGPSPTTDSSGFSTTTNSGSGPSVSTLLLVLMFVIIWP